MFDLRVPELLRHSPRGMPFLQRCIASDELNRWGCELKPTTLAAPFLHGSKRQLLLDLNCWEKLLLNGRLGVEQVQPTLDQQNRTELTPGAVILVYQNHGVDVLFLTAVLYSERLQVFLDQSERQDSILTSKCIC